MNDKLQNVLEKKKSREANLVNNVSFCIEKEGDRNGEGETGIEKWWRAPRTNKTIINIMRLNAIDSIQYIIVHVIIIDVNVKALIYRLYQDKASLPHADSVHRNSRYG